MKKYFVILSAFFLCLGTAGCKNEDLSEDTYIEFKDLDVETVQNLVQGKWRMYKTMGGFVGIQYYNDAGWYYEIGKDKIREVKGNSFPVREYDIKAWRKDEVGWVALASEDAFTGFYLISLHNDTIGTGIYVSPTVLGAGIFTMSVKVK